MTGNELRKLLNNCSEEQLEQDVLIVTEKNWGKLNFVYKANESLYDVDGDFLEPKEAAIAMLNDYEEPITEEELKERERVKEGQIILSDSSFCLHLLNEHY